MKNQFLKNGADLYFSKMCLHLSHLYMCVHIYTHVYVYMHVHVCTAAHIHVCV